MNSCLQSEQQHQLGSYCWGRSSNAGQLALASLLPLRGYRQTVFCKSCPAGELCLGIRWDFQWCRRGSCVCHVPCSHRDGCHKSPLRQAHHFHCQLLCKLKASRQPTGWPKDYGKVWGGHGEVAAICNRNSLTIQYMENNHSYILQFRTILLLQLGLHVHIYLLCK